MSYELNKKFKAGEVIFLQNDAADCAYIIDKGSVEIFVMDDGQKTPISILTAGEIFGEMAIIDGSPRSACATALSEVVVSVVSQQQLGERIKNADPIVRLLIAMLIDRIRRQMPGEQKVGSNVIPLRLDDKNKKIRKLNDVDKFEDIDEASIIEKIKFERELLEALQNEDFILHYQPIMDIFQDSVTGFEALIRWDSPKRGLVRPDLFMGIAEETSLIIPIGQWVVKSASKQIANILQTAKNNNIKIHEDFFVSVNFSGRQLDDLDFFDVLEGAVKDNGFEPKTLKLEITESMLVEGKSVRQWIDGCHARGFKIALDDFGTGYSSLSYLSQFSIDNLKIDKSFVQRINHDPSTLVIVKSVIEMAKGLGVPVIAEGIESQDELKTLKMLGCDFGQGYLFGRPMPIEKALEFLIQASKKAA